MNPILIHELRSRWRSDRPFLILFFTAAGFGLAALWFFKVETETLFDLWSNLDNQVNFTDVPPLADTFGFRSLGDMGHRLFGFLAVSSALFCMIMGAAITAPAIASERQRGLLEQLRLSRLARRSLVLGRLGGALLMLGLLQAAVMPLGALALLLGGVSPREICLALAICFWSGVEGAVIGLWCSARSRNATSALGLAFLVLGLWWAAASVVNGTALLPSWQEPGAARAFTLVGSRWPAPPFVRLIDLTPRWDCAALHPVGLANLLSLTATPGIVILPFGLDAAYFVCLALVLHALLCSLLLFDAVVKSSRPLAHTHWSNTSLPIVVRWRSRLKAKSPTTQAWRPVDRVAGTLPVDLSLGWLARFKDPILAREVRGQFRMRNGSPSINLLRLAAGIMVGAGLIRMVFECADPEARPLVVVQLFQLWFFLTVVMTGIRAASGFTRERDQGTWEGLRLTLLSEAAIVKAKWLSPQISVFYTLVPLWGTLLVCLSLPGATRGTLGPAEVVGFCTMVFGAGAYSAALGMWFSLRCKTSSAASLLTLAGLAFWPASQAVSLSLGLLWLTFLGGTPPNWASRPDWDHVNSTGYSTKLYATDPMNAVGQKYLASQSPPMLFYHLSDPYVTANAFRSLHRGEMAEFMDLTGLAWWNFTAMAIPTCVLLGLCWWKVRVENHNRLRPKRKLALGGGETYQE